MTNLVASRPTATGGGDAPPPERVSQGVLVGLGVASLAVLVGSIATGNGIYLLGLLGFVLALLISVTLHEGGHFLTARHYGMKATQFFVGFGPTLWSKKTGETEWGVKAIPAGGFVKIVGMTSLEEIEPGDEDRAFWRQPAGRRTVVLAAGSTVHFLIAAVVVLLSSLTIGTFVERAPGVGAVSACVPLDVSTITAADKALTADPAADPCSVGRNVPAPASAAGLQPGDVVLSVAGEPTEGYVQFLEQVRANPGRQIGVVVERDGREQTLSITPVAVERPTLARDDDEDAVETVGAIGVAPRFRQATERLGPVEAIENTGAVAGQMWDGIVRTVTEKLPTITKVYSDERDPQGFLGVVGASRISGEVLTSEETLGVKVLSFLLLVASLNLFVGLFNLLPLLPLDGGHIAVLLYEQARDKVKRVFGYTGALQRVDLTKLLPVTYAVVVFFAGFTVWLLGADIVNPIRISQ